MSSEKTVMVTGVTCVHHVRWVRDELGRVDGVSGVEWTGLRHGPHLRCPADRGLTHLPSRGAR